jgi:RNA polymerase sigma factor (sigma-70 family)
MFVGGRDPSIMRHLHDRGGRCVGNTDNEHAAGKHAAFEKIVAEYESPLLRYVTRILRDPNGAQDVVQDTFVKLYRRWNSVVRPDVKISSWLYRVAHNEAVDSIRRVSRRQSLHTRHAAEKQIDRDNLERLEQKKGTPTRSEQVQDALQSLDLRERQLVLLKVYEEKSYKEIGEITGLNVGNIGYILHHAIRKMGRYMRDCEHHEQS